ncbi:CYCD6 isoform 1 [Zea mays]|uniref:CYCD6 n=1 Tax=Zea mays TaxID=4577 RepID=B6TAD6_MAIZE|nr:CYCD6 isoform 1 [Zea mays]ACG34069.1 CYCD6 [Zea mays]ONM58265.1 CYCD6 [Zea mays]|eukprot:NP_001149068.1 CYCD6 [Zea mays]
MATEEWELREEDAYAYEFEFDLENPFTSPADEPIASLLDAEGHHAPSISAAASATRRAAAAFISKVRFGGELAVHPRVAYLALNYVDRFLSKRQLACEQQPWAPRLLAISCLSLAAKMQRVATFSTADIQRDEDFMFDAVTIRRMERVVLGALEWRARSVTPLAFLGFFLSACYPPPQHPPQVAAVKARAVDLLLHAQPEVKMAEFSPSVVAAAALLAAAGEVAAANLHAFQASLAACPFVNSEKLRECGEVLAAAGGVGRGRAAPSADTPVTVLGHQRSASSASETDWINGGDAKKRCMGPPSQWG